MANNRLYLKCVCGERLFLGKHYVDGWHIGDYIYNYHKPFGEVLNEWHEKHLMCFYEHFDNPYTITTENDEYREEQNDFQKEREASRTVLER